MIIQTNDLCKAYGRRDALKGSSLSVPEGAAAHLEDPLTNKRNPELHVCDPNYETIEHARIVLTAYDPVEHFRSTVTIPSIRLADWR